MVVVDLCYVCKKAKEFVDRLLLCCDHAGVVVSGLLSI